MVGNKEDLDHIKQELQDMYQNMKEKMDICIFDAMKNKYRHNLLGECPENAGEYIVKLFNIIF